jgi:hypothetical protein
MATYTDYIGSVSGGQARDGDYATLDLWQAASAVSASNGNIYEAVLIDGSAHYWTDPGTIWNNTKDVNYGIVVRGENSHEGHWTIADRGTSAGAVVTLGQNVSWGTFGDQNIDLTFRDIIFSATNINTFYFANSTVTSGDSGQYSSTISYDRCMFIHDPVMIQDRLDAGRAFEIPVFFNFRTGYESRNPSTGEVSALGKFTINLTNCVVEQAGYNLWRMFPNTGPGPQNVELELNYRGCTWQHSISGVASDFGGRLAYVDVNQPNSSAIDSILRINISGCVSDGQPLNKADIVNFWPSATKYCNMTDTFWLFNETTFKNQLGELESAADYVHFIYTSSNVNYSTNFGYTGASAANTVSFVENNYNSLERNYRQVAGSLGVDYVTTAAMPSVDITGATRDSTPDAGAFELITIVVPGDTEITLQVTPINLY